MKNQCEVLKQYLQPGKHIHLIGIGGVSMRALGLVLKDMGMIVTGSDMSASATTQQLIDKGIPVVIGHRPENITGADCLIRTAAVHNDNPEIAAARMYGVPVFERAQAWGVIMQAYKHAVCVSGTHGKTTATSMVTHILMEADRDPTVMIGGVLPLLGAGHRVGQGDTIVLESCEYCDSFLNFHPTLAIILNIEADHLDYFKDLDAIEHSFRTFASQSSRGILANGDDPHVTKALEGMDYITFGLDPDDRIRAVNICDDWQKFDVLIDDKFYCHVEMSVLGRHNVMNALSALGAAWLMGIPGEVAARGIATFHGVKRRLEYKGRFNGADVYDDYAHHPDELRALIDAVRYFEYKRLVLVFQPHTYSRTKAMFNDFVRELKKADVVILSEIYAARESNTYGISSVDLQQQSPGAVYCETLPEVTSYLREIARPGDLILTVGAGDIYRAGELLLR